MSSEALPAGSTARPVQDLIGIAENVTFWADPAALFRELLVAAGMTLRNPAGMIAANTRLLSGYAGAFRVAGERAIGRDNPGPVAIARGDKRFADPAFQQNPAYFLLAQQYLLFSRLVDQLLDTAGVSGRGSKGALRRQVSCRCARPDEHPGRQPRGPPQGVRHGRQEHRQWRQELGARCPPQRWMAVASRQLRI